MKLNKLYPIQQDWTEKIIKPIKELFPNAEWLDDNKTYFNQKQLYIAIMWTLGTESIRFDPEQMHNKIRMYYISELPKLANKTWIFKKEELNKLADGKNRGASTTTSSKSSSATSEEPFIENGGIEWNDKTDKANSKDGNISETTSGETDFVQESFRLNHIEFTTWISSFVNGLRGLIGNYEDDDDEEFEIPINEFWIMLKPHLTHFVIDNKNENFHFDDSSLKKQIKSNEESIISNYETITNHSIAIKQNTKSITSNSKSITSNSKSITSNSKSIKKNKDLIAKSGTEINNKTLVPKQDADVASFSQLKQFLAPSIDFKKADPDEVITKEMLLSQSWKTIENSNFPIGQMELTWKKLGFKPSRRTRFRIEFQEKRRNERVIEEIVIGDPRFTEKLITFKNSFDLQNSNIQFWIFTINWDFSTGFNKVMKWNEILFSTGGATSTTKTTETEFIEIVKIQYKEGV